MKLRIIEITHNIRSCFKEHQCNHKQFDTDDCPEKVRIGFKCIGCGQRWYSTLRDFRRFGVYLIPNEMGLTKEGRKLWVKRFDRYPEVKIIRGV